MHNIRSTHNVGSIFRTADGFGVGKIICTGYTPYPQIANDHRLPHIVDKIARQIHKTALGAEEIVPFEHYDSLDEWLENNQLPLIALEQSEQSTLIGAFSPPEEYALLLGEEVHGIETIYLTQCDAIVEIPMQGQKESFNVAVSTGIALYALTSA